MSNPEHDLEWNDRLQDWLDGESDERERALAESHVASCESCQQRLRELEGLDAALDDLAPRLTLDETFDARLFAKIDEASEAQRSQARTRAQAEFQAELYALSRNWRRTLTTILPSVLAGIAIALALAMYFDTAEWTQQFATESAGEIKGVDASFVHLLLTSMIGAAIGYVVARWMTAAEE
jgi:anti-sigma factor RsiW